MKKNSRYYAPGISVYLIADSGRLCAASTIQGGALNDFQENTGTWTCDD